MDRKTLEYMEQRAAKARALVNQIENLLGRIEDAKRASYICIVHPGKRNNVVVGTDANKQVMDPLRAEAEALMLQLFIEMTLKHIALLEAELAEL